MGVGVMAIIMEVATVAVTVAAMGMAVMDTDLWWLFLHDQSSLLLPFIQVWDVTPDTVTELGMPPATVLVMGMVAMVKASGSRPQALACT